MNSTGGGEGENEGEREREGKIAQEMKSRY